MPIPTLTTEGLLPEGIHNCSLEELRKEFGSFRSNDRRPQLYRRLEEFITALRRLAIPCFLIVDGSFVTNEPQPNDIDLILVLPGDGDFQAELPLFAYNLLSKKRVHRTWGFDLRVAREGSKQHSEYVEFFQQVRYPKHRRKGLLRVAI